MADFLPIRDCLKEDLQRSSADLDFLKGAYLQPELSADRKVWPESLSTEKEYETTSRLEQSDEEKNHQSDGEKKQDPEIRTMYFR